MTLLALPTIAEQMEGFYSDEEATIHRSVSTFKTHLSHAATVTLKNTTGTQEVPVLNSGDRGFTFVLNGQKRMMQYPRAGYAKVAGPAKLQLLSSFNGPVIMECTITSYTDGSPVPTFEDFPPEEDDYSKMKQRARRKKAAERAEKRSG